MSNQERLTQPQIREPRQYLRAYWPQVQVIRTRLADGIFGLTRWHADRPPEILLDQDLGVAGERATLAHEMLHLERGLVAEHETAVEEHHCDRQAARWLLPDVRTIRAAVRQHGLRAAARILRVPHSVLATRLQNLSEPETYTMNE